MTTEEIAARLAVGQRFNREILNPMKAAFVAKEEIIDLLGVSMVAGENLFILGPPGTAKSALVHDLGRRLAGKSFEYLLTRFTEPNELFGPFDIRKLREGELITNTEGMLPEAALVFLDELLNANSAILNSLLTVLNERVFRRGRETRRLPILMVVGASNHLPEDEALGALFDRFLLRVRSDNVPEDRLADVLDAGWRLDLEHQDNERVGNVSSASDQPKNLSIEEIRGLHGLLRHAKMAEARPLFAQLVSRIRQAGISVTDRRAVKLQRLVAASALLSGRLEANASDLWVLRYIWDREEQREVLAELIRPTLEKANDPMAHPRARDRDREPDVEGLARDLEQLRGRLEQSDLDTAERGQVADRLGLLSERVAWIRDEQQRGYLQGLVKELWPLAREKTV